jgi:hypothetical protein
MPKAAPHFDYFLRPNENDVGFAWQLSNMSSKFALHAANQVADERFGFGADASDLAHVLAAPSF